MRPRRRASAGFTLIEVMIAMTISALGAVSVHHVIQALTRGYGAGMTRMDLDAQGARTMDRVVAALRSADADDLATITASPLSSTTVTFRRSLGFDGVQTTWSDVERLELDAATDVLTWVERPGQPDERRLWRCQQVADLLEGELGNFADDNGNDLFDEAGFSLSYDGELLWVGLTLASADPQGFPIERTWTTWLRPRN